LKYPKGDIIADAPGNMDGMALTSVANQLFTLNTTNPLHLNESDGQLFTIWWPCCYSNVSDPGWKYTSEKCPYFTKHVKNPDQNNYKKLLS